MPSRVRRGPDVDQERDERRRFQDRDALTCWVGWWACQDLNLGPHPYQQNAGNRCANRRFPRWRSTVEAEVMCSHRDQLCVLVVRMRARCRTPFRDPRTNPILYTKVSLRAF